MENNIKTIPILRKEMAEYELELKNSYSNLGNKLFNDANNPTQDKTIITNDELIEWQNLRDERENCSESILNIKKNSDRLSELNNFEKEINSASKTTTKKINQLKPKFLKTLYKDFAPNCPSVFSPVIDEIHQIEAEIATLSEAKSQLEQDKKSAGFFSKISFAPKFASNKRKISKLENKITDILTKNVTNIQDNTEIKNLYSFEAFSDEMKKQFEELSELYASMDESNKKLSSLNEETDFVTKTLSELGVEKNHSKRVSALNQEIKRIDSKLDEVLKNSGLRFVDEFYDVEGKSLTGKPVDSDALKDYTELLNRSSSLRKEIAKIQYNIQYCEVQEKITYENNKIANAERTIKNSEKSIEEAKARIQEAELNKQKAEDELVSLNLESDKLKAKFADEGSAVETQSETSTEAEENE